MKRRAFLRGLRPRFDDAARVASTEEVQLFGRIKIKRVVAYVMFGVHSATLKLVAVRRPKPARDPLREKKKNRDG